MCVSGGFWQIRSQLLAKQLARSFLWAYIINSALFVQEQTTQALPFQTISVSRTGITLLLRWKQTSYLKAFEHVSSNMMSFLYIGDGDSSVYPTLISSIPWGYAITKIECANHCIKCYHTALEKLV